MSLQFLDIGELIRNLNSEVVSCGRIELREKSSETFSTNPKSYRKKNKILRSKGEYRLWQVFERLDERKLGKVFFEAGLMDGENGYGRSYEFLTFRLKHRLQYNSGVILPACKIMLTLEGSGSNSVHHERNDFLGYIGKEPSNLLDKLPTEWFLSENITVES